MRGRNGPASGAEGTVQADEVDLHVEMPLRVKRVLLIHARFKKVTSKLKLPGGLRECCAQALVLGSGILQVSANAGRLVRAVFP